MPSPLKLLPRSPRLRPLRCSVLLHQTRQFVFVEIRPRRCLGLPAQRDGKACDEVFLDYPAEGVASPGTWAGEANVMTFVLSGLSKVALAPQLKLGWIVVAGPASSTLEACRRLEHIADAFLSVNTPAQLALPDLLRRADQGAGAMEGQQPRQTGVEEAVPPRGRRRSTA
mgnify:CR=1 FL=1